MMTAERIDAALGESLYVTKAICSSVVISAHMPLNTDTPLGMATTLFGTVGVIGFFIIAGYLLDEKRGTREFWRRKFTTLVVPWLVCATLTFVVARLLAGSKTSYFSWIIGSGSWYYFMPMLLLCYALFRLIRAQPLRLALIVIGLMSNLLTSQGIIRLEETFVTDFLSVLNWVPWFGVGVLLRSQYAGFGVTSILRWPRRFLALVVMVTALVATIYAATSQIGYWGGWLSVPFELLAVLTVFLVSNQIKSGPLIWVGRTTYPIYLLHMQPAGFINTRLDVTPWLHCVKPVVALGFMCVAVLFLLWAAHLLKLQKVVQLLGIR